MKIYEKGENGDVIVHFSNSGNYVKKFINANMASFIDFNCRMKSLD